MPKLVPLLSQHFTVFAYDRRARGDSGDTKPYAVEREIEDLEAVIGVAGGSAFVFSISSGAILALYAVATGRLKIPKLAIYEPPFLVGNIQHRPPADQFNHLTQLIANDRRSEAVKYYMTKVIGMPAIVPFVMRFLPMWSQMKRNAPSLPYDSAVFADGSLPEQLLKSITVPTLVVGGDKSQELLQNSVRAVAEVIPKAELMMLKGQTHNVSAKALAPVLVDFFRAEVKVPIAGSK